MRFSSRLFKLASGRKTSLYAKSISEVEMYAFSDVVRKNKITFDGNTARCTSENLKFNYNKLIKLNSSHSAVCLDKNVSVVVN